MPPGAGRHRAVDVERIDVDGLTIAYRRTGAGPPVVLLHGYVGDGSLWRHQIDAFSDSHTIVAPDLPGAGGSSDPPEDLGIEGYAACLARFMEKLGLETAHVVGLSFGGALAIAFQRHHRSRTRSLVLVSAYAGWRGSLDPAVAEARLAQADRLSECSSEELVDTLLPTMFALPVAPTDLDTFRAAIEAFHPSGFRAMAFASAEDVSDLLSAIDVPTLLVYGDNDERAPMTVAERLHAAIRGSRLVVLPGAGHVCNVELPERFNDEVREFWAGLDTAERSVVAWGT
jgi:pimeloyl-ACP methyl ester carboxylesterase